MFSVDAYRNKMKGNLTGSMDKVATQMPSLFETRSGKRKWVETSVDEAQTTSPATKGSKH